VIGQELVVKVGGEIALNFKEIVSRQIAELMDYYNIILVSSGAIRTAMRELGIDELPAELPEFYIERQYLSSVGQHLLMQNWQSAFSPYGIKIGQALVDRRNFDNSEERRYFMNLVDSHFKNRSLLIVNENDAVAIEEILHGDNDFIAFYVAQAIGIDMIIFTTEASGLLINGRIVPELNKENISEIEKTLGQYQEGQNDISSKIEVVKQCMNIGSFGAIVSGSKDGEIFKAATGEECQGTTFGMRPNPIKYS